MHHDVGVQYELFLDGASLSPVIPDDSAWTFQIMIVGRNSRGDQRFHFVINGGACDDGEVESSTYTIFASDDYDATVTITGSTLHIVVFRNPGGKDHDIKWVASADIIQVIYAF